MFMAALGTVIVGINIIEVKVIIVIILVAWFLLVQGLGDDFLLGPMSSSSSEWCRKIIPWVEVYMHNAPAFKSSSVSGWLPWNVYRALQYPQYAFRDNDFEALPRPKPRVHRIRYRLQSLKP